MCSMIVRSVTFCMALKQHLNVNGCSRRLSVGLASRVERSEILRILVRVSSYPGYFSWKNQATVFFCF